MSKEKKKEVWLAAYCAAITGLADGTRPEDVRLRCQQIADEAVEDFEKRWHSEDDQPVAVRITGR